MLKDWKIVQVGGTAAAVVLFTQQQPPPPPSFPIKFQFRNPFNTHGYASAPCGVRIQGIRRRQRWEKKNYNNNKIYKKILRQPFIVNVKSWANTTKTIFHLLSARRRGGFYVYTCILYKLNKKSKIKIVHCITRRYKTFPVRVKSTRYTRTHARFMYRNNILWKHNNITIKYCIQQYTICIYI